MIIKNSGHDSYRRGTLSPPLRSVRVTKMEQELKMAAVIDESFHGSNALSEEQ